MRSWWRWCCYPTGSMLGITQLVALDVVSDRAGSDLGWPGSFWWIGMRHKRRPSEPDEPLLETVQESLTQVEHQIWLLRNVFWWYLLPFTISILAFFTQVTLQVSRYWLEALAVGGSLFAFLLALYYFIDYHQSTRRACAASAATPGVARAAQESQR